MRFGIRKPYSIHLRTGAFWGVYLSLFCTLRTNANQEFHWEWHKSQELKADESLRNATTLRDDDKQALAAAIATRIRPMMSDLQMSTEAELRKATLDTRIKLFNLDGKNTSEIIAQATVDCGATGNCPLWIFRRLRSSYKLLLDTYGQTFTIQPTRTNGFLDVVVGTHSSASESSLANYRYRDGSYAEEGCYVAQWEVLENGVTRQLSEPRISPCKK